MGIKGRRSEKAAYKTGRFILANGQADQAVTNMAQMAVIETQIAGKESRPAKLMQERNNLLVTHPLAAHFMANPANCNSPTPQ